MTRKTFAAVGAGDGFSLKPGESLDYVLSGTFVGTLLIERSRTNEQSWETVTSKTAGASGTIKNEGSVDERYRVRCSAYTSGTPVMEFTNTPSAASVEGAGAKAGNTVTVVESLSGFIHKTVLTCVDTPVAITDDAAVAQYGGTGKLYDFPEGLLCVLGAVVDGDVTLGTTGTITNTWAGGVALGTATADTGATLVSTEADIMPEVDVAAATAKVASVDAESVAAALTESGARWLDGTATAKDLFLNLVVDDSATHTTGTGKFTGTITFFWINLGDN